MPCEILLKCFKTCLQRFVNVETRNYKVKHETFANFF